MGRAGRKFPGLARVRVRRVVRACHHSWRQRGKFPEALGSGSTLGVHACEGTRRRRASRSSATSTATVSGRIPPRDDRLDAPRPAPGLVQLVSLESPRARTGRAIRTARPRRQRRRARSPPPRLLSRTEHEHRRFLRSLPPAQALARARWRAAGGRVPRSRPGHRDSRDSTGRAELASGSRGPRGSTGVGTGPFETSMSDTCSHSSPAAGAEAPWATTTAVLVEPEISLWKAPQRGGVTPTRRTRTHEEDRLAATRSVDLPPAARLPRRQDRGHILDAVRAVERPPPRGGSPNGALEHRTGRYSTPPPDTQWSSSPPRR